MKFKTLLLRTLALQAVVLTLTCFNSTLAQRLNLVRPLNASPIVPSGEVDLSRYCRCSPRYKVKTDPQPRVGSD